MSFASLHNQDCLQTLKQYEDESIDLCITDPPYGVEFSKGFNDSKEHVETVIDNWVSEIYRVLKTGSHCYVFVPSKELALFLVAFQKKFQLMNVLATRTYTQSIYLKNNFSFTNQLILYLSKGKAKRLNQVDFQPTSESWLKDKRNKNPHPYSYQYSSFINLFSNEKTTSKNNNELGRHPCEKSVSFEEILIKLSSDEGDTVLDPFMGGGTTGIAAINTNRNFVGCELNKEYFDRSERRIREATELQRQKSNCNQEVVNSKKKTKKKTTSDR